ncbi:aldehyde dehydrogenase family protein [Pseudooceanicola sp. CBS1P-1]|uniref:Aldehyde dehydrogenase family protein n=1 Tax=Pseudooceanicola albus TaxID=2692189 RepID=A0A6L7G3E0_9RHOB|nr:MULTISPECIES: aldehyde dehydrogenase family protein [Pseudooceanicola]MBT9385187.1 aldehyde dehydrogenase family protein [Pseudooceanicola endophyticus]MXN18521.1 aldehyde dehydrogenase family protein [Pseudooceanicola albus]
MSLTLRPHPPKTDGARRFLEGGAKPVLIGAEWSVLEQQFETWDPATGQHLASLSRAGAAEADAAVAAAQAALEGPDWAGMLPAARQALLWKIADLIDAHAEELSELESLDQGKTYATARFAEIPASAAQFRYYAGLATKIHGQTITPSIGYAPKGKQVMAYTRPEPIGVVAAITPWNSPMLMASMKLAPALCAGCTVVLKPAEETSLTAIRLVELMQEAGLPAGVVNLLTGHGHEVGDALAKHPGVAKVAFTGSTEVGRILLNSARGNLKKLTLELGGKSPAIVMPDADLSLSVPGVARGIFANSGQVCVAGSRIYVHRSVHDRFCEGLAAEATRLKLGHGLDPESDLGPLVSEAQAARVARYVDGGRAEGAEVIAGGAHLGGAFYAPTVVTHTRPDMALMREEIFGPVTAVTPFDSPEEVLALANDTEYGLAASVWTQDLSSAHRLAAGIRAGTVWVNCHSYFSPELPKGGIKASGWGVENNLAGLSNYLEEKTVCMVI